VTGAQKQEQQQKKKKKKKKKQQKQGQQKQEPVVDSALSVQAGAVWMGMDVLAAGPGNPPPPAHSQAPQPPALKL